MAGRLDGKVALISGGARGQGAAEGKLFAREGAKIVLGDVLDTEGEQTAREIQAAGGSALYLHLDVTQERCGFHTEHTFKPQAEAFFAEVVTSVSSQSPSGH
jgi:NAD(P)-dependent dehydrogenase (short-subunit alcohol dehydrogenase family)